MSSLLLIRHAQASFLAEDYDKLSPLGIEQAECLGQFLTRNGRAFDQLVTGPRQRQKHSAQIVAACYRKAQLDCPPLLEQPDFDEHALEQLIRQHRKSSLLLDQNASSAAVIALSPPKRFYHLLEGVATDWLKAGAETETVESWQAFRDRVRRGLRTLRQQAGRGCCLAVFTSAGVIGVALQEALGCSDAQALQLSWRLRNASLTEFVFSGERFTLDSFNGLPHLPDRQSWTYL